MTIQLQNILEDIKSIFDSVTLHVWGFTRFPNVIRPKPQSHKTKVYESPESTMNINQVACVELLYSSERISVLDKVSACFYVISSTL